MNIRDLVLTVPKVGRLRSRCLVTSCFLLRKHMVPSCCVLLWQSVTGIHKVWFIRGIHPISEGRDL